MGRHDEENLTKRRCLQTRGEPGRRRRLEVMARSSASVASPASPSALLLLVVLILYATRVEVSGSTASGVPEDLTGSGAPDAASDLHHVNGTSPSRDVLSFQILPDENSKTSSPDLIPYDLASAPHFPALIHREENSTSPYPSLNSADVASASPSPVPSNKTSTHFSVAIPGNTTPASSVISVQPASKSLNDTSTAQSRITTFAPSDTPKADSETPVTEAGEQVNSSDAEPYDLTRGPLACQDVWPLLKKKDKGRCTYRWTSGIEYPEVLCELIGGYKPIAGSYTTLIHNAATYQVTSMRVGNASSPDAGWCAFQSRFEMRKVDTLPPGVPIRRDEALMQIAQSERGARGQEGETLLALVSQGFRAIRLDLRPDAIGAKGALLSDFRNCTTCEPEVWVIGYSKKLGVVDLYFNRAWRVFMEFNPAYMSLATYLLGYLREGAAVEELEVHGGERWDGANVIPVTLQRLRLLDFSRNGLAAFSDLNLQRMPNLQHLNFSYNNFASIPHGVSQLHELRTLDLSHNPLTAPQLLPVLRPLLQLQVLNLSGTPLTSLDPLAPRKNTLRPPADSVSNLYPQLEILDLSSCNISDVASAGARYLLKKIRKLHTFRLANNPLATVPEDLVAQLPAVQVL